MTSIVKNKGLQNILSMTANLQYMEFIYSCIIIEYCILQMSINTFHVNLTSWNIVNLNHDDYGN